MKTTDLMNTGLMKVASQMQADWLNLLRHNYTPQVNEPLSLSILPQAQAPAIVKNLLAPRGSSDDVFARLSLKRAVA